ASRSISASVSGICVLPVEGVERGRLRPLYPHARGSVKARRSAGESTWKSKHMWRIRRERYRYRQAWNKGQIRGGSMRNDGHHRESAIHHDPDMERGGDYMGEAAGQAVGGARNRLRARETQVLGAEREQDALARLARRRHLHRLA